LEAFAHLEQRNAGGRMRAPQQRRGLRRDGVPARRDGPAREHRREARGGAVQEQHHQHAEHHDLVVAARPEAARHQALQPFFEQREDRGADHRAPDVARAAITAMKRYSMPAFTLNALGLTKRR